MIEFKKPNTRNLRETLRLSNKILKNWYSVNLPEKALKLFDLAHDEHQEQCQKILKSQIEEGAEQTRQIIESTSNSKLFNDFVIYLYVLEKDDSDIIIDSSNIPEQQTKAIKEILSELKNVDQMTKEDILALLYLEMNIAGMAQIAFEEHQKKIDFLQLAPWFKLGAHILEMVNNLSSKRKKTEKELFFIDLVNQNHCVVVNAFKNYYNVAYTVLKQAKTDLNLLFAEDCLQKAEKIFENFPRYLKGYVTSKNQLHALNAQINLANNDYEGFDANLRQIVPDPNGGSYLIELMHEAARHYETVDVELSLDYYNSVLRFLKERLKNVLPPLIQLETMNHQNQIENYVTNFKKRLKNQLKIVLRDHFPTLLIKKQEEGMLFFLPLNEMPSNVEMLFKKEAKLLKLEKIYQAGKDVKSSKFVGIQFSTLTFNYHGIIASIQGFLDALQTAASRRSMRKKPDLPTLDERKKVSETKPEKVLRETTAENIPKVIKQDVLLIEEPETKYERTQEKIKKKTHKSIEQISATNAPEVTTICRAADYGFKDPSNPDVTPVYCSEAAQNKLRAKLFVSFKGIEGVEKTVEDQFKAMLNPHPEGILTVGKINQAGVKLWKHPDDLGNSWNFCALRFKRKGASGWLRAIAEPQEKVIVKNKDGKEESHYLFSLGKAVHK